ncbi:MAG: AMP-binding protein, partial [Actinobacteria bacterium]|nr:AMP-binding protein [Actinomycetota bacterium]
LIGTDGREITGTGPDNAGEVFVRSKAAFSAYYKNDADYQGSSRGDFHTVGDIAYWDDEGYLYICDRKSDMIISGGVNIYPAEIEGVLLSHPKVGDAAVFGIPHPDWGEEIKAVIEPEVGNEPSDALTDEILAFAQERLAKFKIPKSIDYTNEMPRDPNGKLYKRKLRDPYWEGRDRAI